MILDLSNFHPLLYLFFIQEMDDLEKQFGAERRMMVDDALNKLNDRYDKLRDDMMKRHEKELADLLVSVGFYEYYLLL